MAYSSALVRFSARLFGVLALTGLSGALPQAAWAHDEVLDEGRAQKLTSMTAELIMAVNAFHRASDQERQAALSKVVSIARQRRNLMLQTIERQPGFTLRQSLPAGLTVGLPDRARDLIERDVELTGVMSGIQGDDMDRQRSTRKFFLEASSGHRADRVQLHASDLPDHLDHLHPASAFLGQEVTVQGMLIDGHLLITGQEAIAAAGTGTGDSGLTTDTAALSPAAVSGAQSALVLIANFQDVASSCSASQVHDLMFGASNSVGGLYAETSYDTVTFSGATYGPWQIPYNSTDSCSYSTWSAALDNMAAAQGINLNNYPRRVYVFPKSTCGAGYGNLGGSVTRSWIFHCGLRDVYAHELGHNLGFQHARTPSAEYGDTSSVMGLGGYPLRHFNAVNKVAAGWIPNNRVTSVTNSGVFAIEPVAAVSPAAPQTLMVPKPDTKDSYFISLRTPIGYDNGLSSSYKNRVSVHRGSASISQYTYLLGTLGVGESFNDATNGYTFTVDSIGADSATVSVTMKLPDCVRAVPTAFISPITQSAAAGKSLDYKITVTNNNNIGCGTSTFGFAAQVPSGWGSAYAPFTVSLASGATATTVWTVTSPTTGVLEQSYPVYTTVYDAAATTSQANVQGNYIVTVPDTTLPVVRITSPADGATVSNGIEVAADASDNIGVARVEFLLNGSLVTTDSAAPYTFKPNLRKASGNVTITARAIDAAGNVASHVITVNVSGSTKGGGGGGKGKPTRL